MPTITNESNVDCPTTSDDDFKFIVHSLKCTLSASDSFHRFIEFSSSHGSMMGENLSKIQSLLIQIILKLLSSFKFKFTSIIDCNGLGRRPGFAEMLHQMDKYCMHDSHHWTLIVEETRQSLDRFNAVNKAKYEDLIQFVHLTVDHITQHDIRLDLQTFAVIFNIMASSKPTTTMGPGLPAALLDFTPLSILPGRMFTNHVPVIKAVNCTTPQGSPATLHSKSCLSTHRRRLNLDALDDDEPDDSSIQYNQSSSDGLTIDYKLIPITLSDIKIYQRPNCYNYKLHNLKSPPIIPLDPSVLNLVDPRTTYRIVIVQRNKRPVRTVHPNGKITVNLAATTTATTITSPDQDDNPKPTKRKRIVWDLD